MRITFKLYAGLTPYLPREAVANAMPLDLPEGTTILQAIAPFNLPMPLVRLVLVNGVYVAPEDRAARTLVEGDVLFFWHAAAGAELYAVHPYYAPTFYRIMGWREGEWMP